MSYERMAISVDGLGKKFRLGATGSYGRLTESLASMPRRFKNGTGRDSSEFWALRDITFEVPAGQIVGVIGANGAGKSTLLKILTRITRPTEGKAHLRGRVGSLLEVGTGFHPELTGRENVLLSGAILGMKREEIESRFDEIVEFSGIEPFLDTPVKRYSSGMQVRLGFAVAAHLDTEIMLIDEVLAVGDAEFQARSLGRMSQIAEGGRTILFVSHNHAAVSRICSRALWLEDGGLRFDGSPAEAIGSYLSRSGGTRSFESAEGIFNPQTRDEFRLHAVKVCDASDNPVDMVESEADLFIEIEFWMAMRVRGARVGFWISVPDGTVAFESYDCDYLEDLVVREPGRYVARCRIPGNLLAESEYRISVNAGVPELSKNYIRREAITSFTVFNPRRNRTRHAQQRSIVDPVLEWSVKPI
jgi:lipopolysaccharide transport system ATP-binding protein